MERKRLIRPITVLKVKGYLKAVIEQIEEGKPFSLDLLAREHQISGSNGTCLVRNNWILEGDVKGTYSFMDEDHNYMLATDTNAKKLIEQVRLLNDNPKNKKGVESGGISYYPNGNTNRLNDNLKPEYEHIIPKKAFKTSEISELIKSINKNKESQLNMFGDAEKERGYFLKIVCSIASGLYNSEIQTYNDIENANELIISGAKDLYQKFTSTSTK